VIDRLSQKPAVIEHSFGGLLTQIIAGRGRSAASVAIDPAPFRGVLPLPISSLKYSLAAELGLPTGVLTDVGSAVAGQNARMLGYLMARHGASVVSRDVFDALAARSCSPTPYGVARTVYVKDVDGVLDGASPVPRIGAAELLDSDADRLPVDRLVLELMPNAKHVKEIQIVNGLTGGNIAKALRGEPVGTVVYAD
jgi:molybdenum storage protein